MLMLVFDTATQSDGKVANEMDSLAVRVLMMSAMLSLSVTEAATLELSSDDGESITLTHNSSGKLTCSGEFEARDFMCAGSDTALCVKVAALETNNTNLKAEVAALKSIIADLKTDNTQLKDNVANLETKQATLKTKQATFETNNTELKTKVAELETKLATFEAQMELVLKRTEWMSSGTSNSSLPPPDFDSQWVKLEAGLLTSMSFMDASGVVNVALVSVLVSCDDGSTCYSLDAQSSSGSTAAGNFVKLDQDGVHLTAGLYGGSAYFWESIYFTCVAKTVRVKVWA